MDINGDGRSRRKRRKTAKKTITLKVQKDKKGRFIKINGRKYRIGKKVKKKQVEDFFKKTLAARTELNGKLLEKIVHQRDDLMLLGKPEFESGVESDLFSQFQSKSKSALQDELKNEAIIAGVKLRARDLDKSKPELIYSIIDILNMGREEQQPPSPINPPEPISTPRPRMVNVPRNINTPRIPPPAYSQVPPHSPAAISILNQPRIRPQKPKKPEHIKARERAAKSSKVEVADEPFYVDTSGRIIPNNSSSQSSSSRATVSENRVRSPALERMGRFLDSAKEDVADLQQQADQQANDMPPLEQADQLHIHGSGVDDKGMSDVQIDRLMKPYHEYLGTVAHDEIISKILPQVKPQTRLGFVINTDKHNQPGSHWQSVFVDGRPNGSMSCEFFDSFGDSADKTIMNGMHKICKKLEADNYLKFKHNRVQYQSDRSSNCGFFASKFLIDRFRGKPFQDASGFSSLSQVHGGEKAIERFKHQMGYNKYFRSFKGNGLTRDEYPPSVRRQLNNGTLITSLRVGRTPISSYINTVLNAVSLGGWNSAKNDLGYSDVFHLYLVINERWKLERNHVIEWSDYRKPKDETSLNVPLSKTLTVSELLQTTADQFGPDLQVYDPGANNCQVFVVQVLGSNGLLTQPLKDFIQQDIQGAFERLPFYTKWLAKKITDVAHGADILVKGRGKT